MSSLLKYASKIINGGDLKLIKTKFLFKFLNTFGVPIHVVFINVS